MRYSPKRPRVTWAALCAAALLAALVVFPALAAKNVAAQAGSPVGHESAWVTPPSPKVCTPAWGDAANNTDHPAGCRERVITATVRLDGPACRKPAPVPDYCGKLMVSGGGPILGGNLGSAGLYRDYDGRTTIGGDSRYKVSTNSTDDEAILLDPPTGRSTSLPALVGTCRGSSTLGKEDVPTKHDGEPCHAYRTLTLLDPPGCHEGGGLEAKGYPCGAVLLQGAYDATSSVRTLQCYNIGVVGSPACDLNRFTDPYGGAPNHPDGQRSGDSQIYDPAHPGRGWQPVAGNPFDHMGQNSQAVLLDNGNVLVVPAFFGSGCACRDDSNRDHDPAMLFDPMAKDGAHPSGAWYRTGPMYLSRRIGAMVFKSGLDGNQVVVAGGWSQEGNSPREPGMIAEVYTPGAAAVDGGAGTWTPTIQPLPYGLAFASTTPLTDGTVLVTGGDMGQTGSDPQHPDPLDWHQSCPNSIFFCGSHQAMLYHPAAGVWEVLLSGLKYNRTAHAATRMPDGRVLLTGGFVTEHTPVYGYASFGPVPQTEVYDPANKTFSSTTPDLPDPQGMHSATVAPISGCETAGPAVPADYMCARVVVVGGVRGEFNSPQYPDYPGQPLYTGIPSAAPVLTPPPLITGLTPNRGPATRSTPVKVSGFALAGSNLSIDGAPAPPCAASGCPPVGDPPRPCPAAERWNPTPCPSPIS